VTFAATCFDSVACCGAVSPVVKRPDIQQSADLNVTYWVVVI